jgi:hypothetical protein
MSAPAQQPVNPFAELWRLGYRRLVPIVPIGAPISERSSLAKRPESVGKAVGIRGGDGLWRGFDWTNYEATEADVERWFDMGAGVGIKTGEQPDGTSLIGIDADTLDDRSAAIVAGDIRKRFGVVPSRIGRAPKVLYVVRVDGPVRYARVEFGQPDAKGNYERVELLSTGRQFVAAGVHPVTRAPYRWVERLVPFNDLPVWPAEALGELLSSLRELLPNARPIITEGSGEVPPQESLRGSLDLVRKAVAVTPNTSAVFPSRDAWRDYGYAIKAALPDQPDEALALFQEWSASWDAEEGNDPGYVEAEWRRMRPPFKRGANWLYELAEQASPERFSRAEQWFDASAAEIPLSGFESAVQLAQGLYEVLSIEDLFNRPDPKFLIDRHLPQASVGFLYGDPGTGKSFIALDWALHIAFARELWHGDKIDAPPAAHVIYLAGEGASGFKTRVQAWLKRHNIPESEHGRFGLIHQSVNFMRPEDIRKLAATLKDSLNRSGSAVQPAQVALVTADTVSRSMPGADENLQKEMTLFVAACDALKQEFGCVVLGVHHAGKNGDMRGSTVLRGAGDFVFKLDRKKGATVGELHCEKMKDAPDGWGEPYRFDLVELGDGRSSLVPTRCAVTLGPTVELTASVSRQILLAMSEAWEAGEPWGKSYQSGERQASRIMVSRFGLTVEKAEELLSLWEQTGTIAYEIASQKTKRRGLRVKYIPEPDASIFD